MSMQPLTKKILEFILSRPSTTATELVGRFSGEITAVQAVKRVRGLKKLYGSRSRSLESQVLDGKRHLIHGMLQTLYSSGRIVRQAKGVYGPPKPRLLQTG